MRLHLAVTAAVTQSSKPRLLAGLAVSAVIWAIAGWTAVLVTGRNIDRRAAAILTPPKESA